MKEYSVQWENIFTVEFSRNELSNLVVTLFIVGGTCVSWWPEEVTRT